MNPYLNDSALFFQYVSINMNSNLKDNEVIQLTINLALGCERLLKGILYDINPTFILIEPDFKHSLQTLYAEKIIPEADKSKELARNPNFDVISFNNSLLKAQFVSKTTLEHKNILFAISNARDVIAHCELNLLNKEKLREILQRDFYTMLTSYSVELSIKKSHFFDGRHIKLSRISGALQTDLRAKVKLLLETHNEIWKSLRGNPGFIKDKVSVTNDVLLLVDKDRTECPACKNDAVLSLKPIIEFNVFKGEEEVIGYDVKKLKCHYCKLETSDPSILDYLKIMDIDFINTTSAQGVQKSCL